MKKTYMMCINNTGYVDCLTTGKHYWVDIEECESHDKMHHFLDDNGEPLQSMLPRFIEVPIQKGDIIQVNPNVDGWGGCLLVVSEACQWGVKGYAVVPFKGQAHGRISNGDFMVVGEALFVLQEGTQ